MRERQEGTRGRPRNAHRHPALDLQIEPERARTRHRAQLHQPPFRSSSKSCECLKARHGSRSSRSAGSAAECHWNARWRAGGCYALREREAVLIRRPRQATHLETLGFDLSSPLWSASLLARKDDPAAHDAITKVHRDFINAGADIIGTMTYQLSDLAWRKAYPGSAPPAGEVARLMAEALRLAAGARASSSRPQTLISLSLGPYGAALANGAECA